MKLSEELAWRGFIHQTTITDFSLIDDNPQTFYHGYDASADSQTVGNLASMMLDRLFLKHGHKAIILAGGATSLIGDPGGKDKERKLQDEDTIAHNVACAQKQLQQVLRGYEFEMVNNLDWFSSMNVLHFLRDVGKHYSMTPLVQRDYIATRMGEGGNGISFTEFSYTILQGYDYLRLFEDKGARLQLCGSDQWGNCISGVDLIRRVHGEETHVLTSPLVINKATGRKFGKSEAGAVWLDSNKTSPFEFYQFWLNIDDDAVEDYFKIYTDLEKPEVDDIITKFKTDRATRSAQKRLAYEVTKLVHGEEQANSVRDASGVLFGSLSFASLNNNAIAHLAKEISTTMVTELSLPHVVQQAGLASSVSEARRFIDSGAVCVNGEKTNQLTHDMFINGQALLRRGKNSFALLTLDKQ